MQYLRFVILLLALIPPIFSSLEPQPDIWVAVGIPWPKSCRQVITYDRRDGLWKERSCEDFQKYRGKAWTHPVSQGKLWWLNW